MSVTDEIKTRIDIVNYVRRFVPTLKKAGRHHKACCPFHSEKTPSFVVNPERQTWRCFGACAEGGDLFTFAQKMNGWDFKEALHELAQEAGVVIRRQTAEQKSRQEHLERLRGLLATAAEHYHSRLFHAAGRTALSYVHARRGLTDETIKNFQIGCASNRWDEMLTMLRGLGYGEDEIIEAGLAIRSDKGRVYDRFRGRLMIPIRDERGRVVGFGGRVLQAEDQPKYINSPQTPLFDKSRLLFGLDGSKRAIRDTETVVIVEGYLDVIQAWQAGWRNVVAQMGTAMTEAQVRLVAPRYAKKVVMALDADEAGQSATRRSLEGVMAPDTDEAGQSAAQRSLEVVMALDADEARQSATRRSLEIARQTLAKDFAGKLSVDMRILQIPNGKDPDDFLRESPDEWPALVDRAQSVADFVIDMETAGLSAQAGLQERQSLANRILPILMVSENNLYQRENIQKLARRLRISERDLLAWAQEQWPTQQSPVQPPPVDAPPDMPPYWDDDDEAMPPEMMGEAAPPPAQASKKQDRAIEPYCLGLLLKHPNLLYQVNRKLRELADSDEGLLRGPLRDLGTDDFTQSQYRTLMGYFQQSMTQDDMEPLNYVKSIVERELRVDFEALLLDEPAAVSALVQGAFQVDLLDIFKKRSGKGPTGGVQQELVSRALQLRRERLEQERVEMQYLQEEAQSGGDMDDLHHARLHQKILLSIRAKARIDLEVSQAVRYRDRASGSRMESGG